MDIQAIRAQFPILQQSVNGKPLVYLDNGASAQKPSLVIDAIKSFSETSYANIHRGVHTLSQQATLKYEGSRSRVANFIGGSPDELIFTSGTTAGLNMIAGAFRSRDDFRGGKIMVTSMEHHSNLLPWIALVKFLGATLLVAPSLKEGQLDVEWIEKEFQKGGVHVFAFTHVSNVFGTHSPIEKIAFLAQKYGVVTVVDGAQFVPHRKLDVRSLGVDFYSFGAHKMYGPAGVGALWGKKELLGLLEPWQWGGGMIQRVSLDNIVLADVPQRFEAGTPPIEGAIGFAAACDFIESVGWADIGLHEDLLMSLAEQELANIQGVRVLAPGEAKFGVISFVLNGAHPYDVGTILDQMGVAVRTGHHCCQPLMDELGLPGTIRAGFALYNTVEEVEKLVYGVKKAIKLLGL
ncbi:MAG: cysteine desulfurase, SufS subfamily [Bacteroidota bacterium]|jgi:cysteine desulfurase/selenocysteine lyase